MNTREKSKMERKHSYISTSDSIVSFDPEEPVHAKGVKSNSYEGCWYVWRHNMYMCVYVYIMPL